jgi:hypothetical protein
MALVRPPSASQQVMARKVLERLISASTLQERMHQMKIVDYG